MNINRFAIFLVIVIGAMSSKGYASEGNGESLYQTFCAACHGVAGEGNSRWPGLNELGDMTAPPHGQKGHTWRHSTEELIGMTLKGYRDPYNETEFNTMPAFENILTREQVVDIFSFIKTWWSPKQIDDQEKKNN